MMARKKIRNKQTKPKNIRQPGLLPLPGKLRRLGEDLLDRSVASDQVRRRAVVARRVLATEVRHDLEGKPGQG